MIATLTFKRL